MSSRTIMFVLVTLAAAALFLNCADVPSTGPTPPEFFAEYRFVHANPGLGSVQIAVDGAAQGSLTFTGNLAHKRFLAGSRQVNLTPGGSQAVAMPTDQRGTIVLLSAGAGVTEFFRLDERRIFDSPRTGVRVANFNRNFEVDVTLAGPDTISVTGLAYKEASGYNAVRAGNYAITVKPAGVNSVTLATSSITVSASHTSMIMGDSTAVVANLTDN